MAKIEKRKANFSKTLPKIRDNRLKHIESVHAKIQRKLLGGNEIIDILNDLSAHLDTPSGNLDNYYGRYNRLTIDLLMEHYPAALNQEDINSVIESKVMRLHDHLYECILRNRRVWIRPELVKMYINYIKGREDFDQNAFGITINVPFVESSAGEITLPVAKTSRKQSYGGDNGPSDD